MPKKVHQVVNRPGRVAGEPHVQIPIAEDLATEPGSPIRDQDVTFYSREYPIESQTIEKASNREWDWIVFTPEILKYRKQHEEANKQFVDVAAISGEIETTVKSVEEIDFTASIREKARELVT